MTKLESLLQDFQKAVKRFEDVLKQEKNEFMRDSSIKRFEMTFDLAWKTTKTFLEERYNMRCTSPRSCFREAFNQGLIEYDDWWVEMTKIRNYTVHTYKEQFAEKIYGELPQALEYFQTLLKRLNAQE